MSAPTTNQSDARSLLVISGFSSKCGECGKGANPSEETHATELGWESGAAGCGVRWTHVTSEYVGAPGLDAAIRKMRPDLLFVSAEERFGWDDHRASHRNDEGATEEPS